MASNPRAAAQRATAARVRANRKLSSADRKTILPRAITRPYQKAQRAYGDRVLAGKDPKPVKGSPGSNVLASLASKAAIGKADAKYLAFREYWYHDDKPVPFNELEQEETDERDEEEEEE